MPLKTTRTHFHGLFSDKFTHFGHYVLDSTVIILIELADLDKIKKNTSNDALIKVVAMQRDSISVKMNEKSKSGGRRR